MRYTILVVLLALIPSLALCQKFQEDEKLYEYEPVENNLYPGYEKSKLIVDYFNSYGISTSERYSYEILVIDNMLMLAFTSPDTADYNEISFETKRPLTKEQLDSIIQILISSKIKQLKNGIPRPFFTGYAKEVLIVKSEKLSIAGGMFFSTIDGDETDIPIEQQRKTEKEENSSIGGDYEAVFKILNNLFVEKNDLLHKMHKFHRNVSTLTTPTFQITITPKCKDYGGAVDCDNIEYIGINRKNKNSIHLKGRELFSYCPNDVGDGIGKTPCIHLGYEFRNGDTVYLVSDKGILKIKKNSKILLQEQGKWDLTN